MSYSADIRGRVSAAGARIICSRENEGYKFEFGKDYQESIGSDTLNDGISHHYMFVFSHNRGLYTVMTVFEYNNGTVHRQETVLSGALVCELYKLHTVANAMKTDITA